MSNTTASEKVQDAGTVEVGEEEEETCGFCIFMKAGGCETEFTVCMWKAAKTPRAL